MSKNIFSQNFNYSYFEKLLQFSELLLTTQPNANQVESLNNDVFKLSDVQQFQYIFEDKVNHTTITAYLHIETLQLVYVEFFIKTEDYPEVKDYLMNVKLFEWPISEHNCDYLNNNRLQIALCPLGDKTMVHINLI